MSLDVDEGQAEKGKTGHSTEGNSIGRMVRRKTNDGRQSIDGMVERAVGVLTTSEDGDGQAGQRHEPADSDMVHRDHAARETP